MSYNLYHVESPAMGTILMLRRIDSALIVYININIRSFSIPHIYYLSKRFYKYSNYMQVNRTYWLTNTFIEISQVSSHDFFFCQVFFYIYCSFDGPIYSNTSTPPHSHSHAHSHSRTSIAPHTVCFAHFKLFWLLAWASQKAVAYPAKGRQRRGTREQGNSGEVEGVALYCGNHKSCTFFCHSEPQSYNMSELFVAVHFSVAANEESRKREQEKEQGEGGGKGQCCSC